MATLPRVSILLVAVAGAIIVLGCAKTAKADKPLNRDRVKVAAVQVLGYDKGEPPREGYDPTSKLLPYIDRAGKEGAQLIAFPEYLLGRIAVPGEETKRIASVAKRNAIYVIVGCWELLPDNQYANTALVFDRTGAIAGKYRKTHAAVDHYEGNPAWTKPPKGKSREWMLRNDPEWEMQAGESLPVFDFDFGRVGIMTCYDGWFPEPARVLSLRGAELIVWINGRRGNVEEFIVKSTIFQSHVAMVTTNQSYGGGTMIADMSRWPDVTVKARVRTEAFIISEINLKQIRDRRSHSRNFAQRRPDLYGALVAPIAVSSKEGASQVADPP